MPRWQTWLGVLIGFIAGLIALALVSSRHQRRAPDSGAVLSECDGHLRRLVIQYEPSSKPVIEIPYRQFLRALEPDITVHVVCPTQAGYEELSALVGPVRCKLLPVVVGHAMTTWSRDRWVACAPPMQGAPLTLWAPRAEAAEELWPARAGDQRIANDLAIALGDKVRARRSSLYFDGGDFLADSENVFVVPRVLGPNLQHTVNSREEFLAVVAAQFKRHVILLEQAPDHHAAMFMASVGNRTMVVGDPASARALFRAGSGHPAAAIDQLPGGPDFTLETQHRFDAVAAQCHIEGYRVVRIPVVPSRDARTFLTYVNVLLDQQGERRIVYLPFYRGQDPMNAAARIAWQSLGYEVRPVDCTNTFRHFGCLHCLVNVLERSPHGL